MLPMLAPRLPVTAWCSTPRWSTGHRNIRVNSIRPGLIVSEMSADLVRIPGMLDTFNKEIPLGRVGYPEDYANAVLWLSGPAFVTGQNIPVAGGAQLTRFPRPDEYPNVT